MLVLQKNEGLKEVSKNISLEKTNYKQEKPVLLEKSVQTDLKNIENQLVSKSLKRGAC